MLTKIPYQVGVRKREEVQQIKKIHDVIYLNDLKVVIVSISGCSAKTSHRQFRRVDVANADDSGRVDTALTRQRGRVRSAAARPRRGEAEGERSTGGHRQRHCKKNRLLVGVDLNNSRRRRRQ